MNHLFLNLKKDIRSHGADYLILVASGLVFLLLLKLLQGQRLFSFLTTVAFVGSYIFWAIFHHSKEEVQELKIVLEYVLIGFTVLLFIGLIFFT